MAITLTAADLERFMLAGSKIESEMRAMEATTLACKADAERFLKIANATERQKLRIIQRLIQSNTPADFANFVDNLGA